MRTTLDFPNDLFVHLKTRAAIDGVTLRETVIGLLERGLAAIDAPSITTPPKKYYPPPSLPPGYTLDIHDEVLRSGKLWDFIHAEDDARILALTKS